MKQSTKNLLHKKKVQKRKSLIRVYGLGLTIIVLSLAWAFLSQPDGETYNFTVRPQEAISDSGTKYTASTFSLDIPVPLPDMNVSSNRLKINQIKGSDDGPRECSQTKEGTADCYTTKYVYTISTGSPSVIPGVDRSVNISIPAYVSGRGSHQGRGPDKSQSDIRYFQSKLVANANVSVTLDSKWCPRLRVEPDFLWKDSTKVEVFHRAKVDLQYRVEKRLRDPVVRMGRIATSDFIDCESVRQQLLEAWTQLSFPINKPDATSRQFINIKPFKLGYVGLKLVSDKLFMEFNISASTEIASKPVDAKPRELPAAITTTTENNMAYVSVPVSLSYLEILKEIHKQVGPEPFFTRNRFGEHTITIRKMRLFPANKQLVIGLHVHMTNTEEWRDKSGWVYILATPKLMPSSQGIMLSDLRYSEGADDAEWVTIRRALKESILDTLEQRGLVVYFNESTNQLLTTMKNEIERPRLDVPVKFSDSQFTINTISLLENQLIVDGALGASANYITRETSFDTIAQTGADSLSPGGAPHLDPAVQRIQNQVDSLIRQIEGLEKKLSQFRRILNN